MGECVNALKEWTGKTTATIVNDSTVDEFTNDGLFQMVKGTPRVTVDATTDCDVFGRFNSVAATKQMNASTTRTCPSFRSSRVGRA